MFLGGVSMFACFLSVCLHNNGKEMLTMPPETYAYIDKIIIKGFFCHYTRTQC